MTKFTQCIVALIALLFSLPGQSAEPSRTIDMFKETPGSAEFFDNSIAYAVYPTVAKAGLVVGGAFGKGHVFKQGAEIGTSEMTQVSVGFQWGGQAFSQIIFFKDEQALEAFISSKFEFGAEASAVALTAGVSAKAGSTGTSSSIGVEKDHNESSGGWYRGMAIFTIAKGGLMYQATVGGQKFVYTPNS